MPVETIDVELPYYFQTDEYGYAKEYIAIREDLAIIKLHAGSTYRSFSIQTADVEKVTDLLTEKFSRYKCTTITRQEFDEALVNLHNSIFKQND